MISILIFFLIIFFILSIIYLWVFCTPKKSNPDNVQERIVFKIGPVSTKKESIDEIRGNNENHTHKYKKT